MPTGTIKFFNTQKGFGFIVSDEGNKEVFLPAASLSGADSTKLKPGQRIAFEIENEARGPKAVSLTFLERPAAPPPPAPAPAPTPSQTIISIFHDSSSDESEEVLDALRDSGRQFRESDIVAAPPTPQELRQWSLMLGGKGLVRRFHPMFHALQLDDRFIGEDEFWTSVSEHPVLIETPLLVSKDGVAICKSADDVRAFFNPARSVEPQRAKGLSPRLAAMIRGDEILPLATPKPEKPAPVVEAPAQDIAPPKSKPAAKPVQAGAVSAPKAKPKAAAKPEKAKSAPAKKAPAKKPAPAPKAKTRK
jgi:CspA family cold shock protein